MGNQISLSSTSTASNLRGVMTIKKERKGSKRKTRKKTINQNLKKTHSMEGCKNNNPFNSIKSFLMSIFKIILGGREIKF